MRERLGSERKARRRVIEAAVVRNRGMIPEPKPGRTPLV